MDIFLNELSLHGQFRSLHDFTESLKNMLGCKEVATLYPFYCIRSIDQCLVTANSSFRQAVLDIGNISITRTVIIWIDKKGPFWQDDQQHDSGEYFECAGHVVTDCSLGEAAFKIIDGAATTVVSFNPSDFLENPLEVIWKHSDDEATSCHVPNFWNAPDLEAYLTECETPVTSWLELLERVQTKFTHLTFLAELPSKLVSWPFNSTIAEAVEKRLGVLNRLKTCFDSDGTLTSEGHKILSMHFQGTRAWFSDESDANKQTFRNELTFKKPDGEKIFCPYHGKISHHYFRIHHSWPIRHNEPLYVAYIGPKITKN